MCILPGKTVPKVTYTVSGGTLNPSHSITYTSQTCVQKGFTIAKLGADWRELNVTTANYVSLPASANNWTRCLSQQTYHHPNQPHYLCPLAHRLLLIFDPADCGSWQRDVNVYHLETFIALFQ